MSEQIDPKIAWIRLLRRRAAPPANCRMSPALPLFDGKHAILLRVLRLDRRQQQRRGVPHAGRLERSKPARSRRLFRPAALRVGLVRCAAVLASGAGFYGSASGRERWRLSMASSGRFAGVVMCVNTLWQLWRWVVVLVDKTGLWMRRNGASSGQKLDVATRRTARAGGGRA